MICEGPQNNERDGLVGPLRAFPPALGGINHTFRHPPLPARSSTIRVCTSSQTGPADLFSTDNLPLKNLLSAEKSVMMRAMKSVVRLLSSSLLILSGASALIGCSDDSDMTQGGTESDSDTGSSSSEGTIAPTTGTTTEDPTAGSESDSESNDTSDTTEGPTGSESDSDSDDTTSTTDSPWDGEPLPDAPEGEWNWIDFPESSCRSGSSTGIGVRYGEVNKVVIYFMGGGACFNATTCGLNPGNYGQLDFAGFTGGAGESGIFNPNDSNNPTYNWSHVYIPYCTGDVHFGSNPGVMVPGLLGGPQDFVGFDNVTMYLDRIVPTFIDAEQVLVTGESAGGFGAALNYDRIADAFPNTPVTLLDDSGPPLSDSYLHACLQQQWRELWGFDETLPEACTDCFGPDGGGIYQLAPYLANKHGNQKMALISSTGDDVIRLFFGFGITEPDDPCGGSLLPVPMEQWFFEDGLYDLRDNILDGSPVWGSYLIDSTTHTWIGGDSLFSTEVDGVKLHDWVTDLVDGQVAHVAP